MELKSRSRHCEFGTLKDSLIRDIESWQELMMRR